MLEEHLKVNEAKHSGDRGQKISKTRGGAGGGGGWGGGWGGE